MNRYRQQQSRLIPKSLVIAILLLTNCSTSEALDQENAWEFEVEGNVWDAAVVDGVVYAAASDGNLYALDLHTGDPIWKTPTGQQIASRPAFHGDLVLIAGCKGQPFNPDSYESGEVFAARRSSGEIQWHVPIDGAFQARVYCDGDQAAACAGPYVYALDPATGEKQWQYKHKTGMVAGIALDAGVLVVQGADGRIQAFDARTGAEKWKASAENRSYFFPAMQDGLAYIGDLSGNLKALRAETGEPVWTMNTGGGLEGNCAIVDDVLLFTNRNAEAYGVDKNTGKVLWKRAYPIAGKNSTQFAGLCASESRMAFSALNKGAYVLDSQSGTEISHVPLDSPLALVSLGDDLVLYSFFRGGKLTAVQIKNAPGQ